MRSKTREETLHPFKPQLDRMSETIEAAKQQLFGKIPRHVMLVEKGKEYQQKATEKLLEKEGTELENCSFVPKINKSSNLCKVKTDAERVRRNTVLEIPEKILESSLKSQKLMSFGMTNKSNPSHVVFDLKSGTAAQAPVKADETQKLYRPIYKKTTIDAESIPLGYKKEIISKQFYVKEEFNNDGFSQYKDLNDYSDYITNSNPEDSENYGHIEDKRLHDIERKYSEQYERQHPNEE